MQKKLKWGFQVGNHRPYHEAPLPKNVVMYGATSRQQPDPAGNQDIWIFLNDKLAALLLRKDLTAGEKAGAEYMLAITMLHELTHALWYHINPPASNISTEPYYENSPLSELGFELESKVNIANPKAFESIQ